jgi:LysM repeat protein
MPKLFTTFLLICFTYVAIGQSKNGLTIHEVEKGETLYSISRKYHVTVDAIQNANKSLGGSLKLKIGQILTIPGTSVKGAENKTEKAVTPTTKASVTETKPVKPQSKQEAPTACNNPSVHIVEKGETFYGISKANGLTVKQLRDANHMSEDMKLKVGQKLIIPSKNQEAMYKSEAKEPISEHKPVSQPVPVPTTTEQGREYLKSEPTSVVKPEPVKQEVVPASRPTEQKTVQPAAKVEKAKEAAHEETPFLIKPAESTKPVTEVSKPVPASPLKNENKDPNNYAAVFAQYYDSGKKKVIYRGIGMFMQSDNPGNQFLALYNYADMGSIVKVTNLMSKETIYVKIIGKVPASDNEKDVILKVSSEAANKLKVSEDKFLLEVTGYNGQ